MKKLTVLSTFILSVIAISTLLFYSSCKPNPCKDMLCLNGGSCIDGNCICASGFQGVNCSTVTPVKKTYKVTYEIGCTDCEVIYYSDSMQTNGTEYHKNNSWTYTFYANNKTSCPFFP